MASASLHQLHQLHQPDLETSLAEVIRRFGDDAPALIARLIRSMGAQHAARQAAAP